MIVMEDRTILLYKNTSKQNLYYIQAIAVLARFTFL